MPSLTLDTPLTARLPETEEMERHQWEGVLDVAHPENEASVRFLAILSFRGDLIEGSGKIGQVGQSSSDVDIAGETSPDRVRLELWPRDAVDTKAPFLLLGAFGVDRRSIEGGWSLPCSDPEGCNCGGGRGAFQMKRTV